MFCCDPFGLQRGIFYSSRSRMQEEFLLFSNSFFLFLFLSLTPPLGLAGAMIQRCYPLVNKKIYFFHRCLLNTRARISTLLKDKKKAPFGAFNYLFFLLVIPTNGDKNG